MTTNTNTTTANTKPAAKKVAGRTGMPAKRIDTQRKRRSPISEYGMQMREKQNVKKVYGVSEKQFVNYVKKAEATTTNTGIHPSLGVYISLEARLDNVVFRMGLTKTRAAARQMVSHGHILVNGRKLNIPSHRVRVGDIISIREGSKNTKLFTEPVARSRDFEFPKWMNLDINKLEAKIEFMPKEIEGGFDFAKILEFYSR